MTAPPPTIGAKAHHGAAMLRLIGAFKLAKSLVLIVAMIATLRLMHEDIDEVILDWAHRLHLAPGNQLVQKALDVKPSQLRLLAVLLGAYAVMFAIEGIGLLLVKHWAEWMAVITTSGLIPLEVYELIHHPTAVRIGALVVNLAIVVYLIVVIRRQHRQQLAMPS